MEVEDTVTNPSDSTVMSKVRVCARGCTLWCGLVSSKAKISRGTHSKQNLRKKLFWHFLDLDVSIVEMTGILILGVSIVWNGRYD